MLKVININGKDMELRSSAATPMIYKAQFHSDFFGDVVKMGKVFDGISGDEMPDDIDMDVIYHIVWALAKNAHKDIGDVITYFAQFDEFPIKEIADVLSTLIESMFKVSKK